MMGRVLRCMSPELALLRHAAMSAQWSLSGEKRKSSAIAQHGAIDPGCVKTRRWI